MSDKLEGHWVSGRVQFHETDAMGVVHHAAYIKYFENARVDWMISMNLLETDLPYADCALAVLQANCEYQKPLRFADEYQVCVQARREGLKIRFRYAIFSTKSEDLVAKGDTLHVLVSGDLKPLRPVPKLRDQLESSVWTETWP